MTIANAPQTGEGIGYEDYSDGLRDPNVGHVQSLCGAINESIDYVEKNLEALVERLSPVLKSQNPEAIDGEGNPPTPARCDVADRLGNINDRLHGLTEKLARIKVRVDV